MKVYLVYEEYQHAINKGTVMLYWGIFSKKELAEEAVQTLKEADLELVTVDNINDSKYYIKEFELDVF